MLPSRKIEKLREQIVNDYTRVVFRDKLPPNPRPRGRYGVAYIPLRVDAEHKWQKTFAMHGEKEEAFRKIVDGWIEEDLIERPTKMVLNGVAQRFPYQNNPTHFLGGV